jgi:hypothetical protein
MTGRNRMTAIDEVVTTSDARPAVQPIAWRRANWETVWDAYPGLPGRAVLDAIDTEVATERAGSIRRHHSAFGVLSET